MTLNEEGTKYPHPPAPGGTVKLRSKDRRSAANRMYVTSLPRLTLQDISYRLEIPVSTLKQWSRADKWIKHRKDHWAQMTITHAERRQDTFIFLRQEQDASTLGPIHVYAQQLIVHLKALADEIMKAADPEERKGWLERSKELRQLFNDAVAAINVLRQQPVDELMIIEKLVERVKQGRVEN